MEYSIVEMYFHANSCGVTDKDASRVLDINASMIYKIKQNGTANIEMAKYEV